MARPARRQQLAQLLVALCAVLGSVSAGAAAAEPDAVAPESSFVRALTEGKRLLKQHQASAAVDQLVEAVALAERSALPADEQSVAHYLLGLALAAAARDGEAVVALRQALKLRPDDSECRLELAQSLLRSAQYREAQREATAALQAGLREPVDQEEARRLSARAQRESLRERFNADLLLSFGYDSNVLESSSSTSVGGQCAGGCRPAPMGSDSTRNRLSGQELLNQMRSQAMLLGSLYPDYAGGINSLYSSPRPAQKEWDLPTRLQVDLRGRLLGKLRFELWLGYRFRQFLLTSTAFDHDAYNLQEHALPLMLLWQPRPWLRIRSRLEGFVNFSGLKQLLPFQGGLSGSLEATAIESPRWRTRVSYLHHYRRSIDRSQDSYLDGQRDELRLGQELRISGPTVQLQSQLGYRLHSERTGTFNALRSLQLELLSLRPLPGGGSTTMVPLGSFDYAAPLGYLGNELLLRLRLYLLRRLELEAGLSYDYRRYDGQYGATFSPDYALVPVGGGMCRYLPATSGRTLPCGPTPFDPDGPSPPSAAPASVTLPASQRLDSLVTVDTALLLHLSQGFSLELSYLYQRNFSNIANLIDNRSYDKHAVAVAALYSF